MKKHIKIILSLFAILFVSMVIFGLIDLDTAISITTIAFTIPLTVVPGQTTSQQIKEKRGEIYQEYLNLLKKAKEEGRMLEKEEDDKRNDYLEQMDWLDKELDKAHADELRQAKMAGQKFAETQQQNEERNIKSFSFLKVIRSMISELNQPLDGIEKEMIEEGKKEMREAGLKVSGIPIPTIVLRAGNKSEKRNMLAGTDTAGGHWIPEEKGSFIEGLFPRMRLMELGAQQMTGLQGNINFPREVSDVTAYWKAEGVAASESTPELEDVDFTPHKLTAYTRFSRDLMIQSSVDVEAYVRNRLQRRIALAVDLGGINGSGTNNQPTGILNTTGIGAPETAINGQQITRKLVTALIKEIKVDDADIGSLGFLTNPYVENAMLNVKLDAGSGRFLLENANDPLLGYRYVTSTQVPNDLTKGDGENLSALIFGNFGGLSIGQWGPIEIIVNPYSEDTTGKIRVSIHSWWDILIEHPEYFSALKAIITEV